MLYLCSTGSDLDALDAHPDIAVMTGPRTGGLAPVIAGRRWATHCDALSKHGYSEDAYYRHLLRMQPYHGTCLFAVVPDVPGNGEATLSVYWHAAPSIAEAGYPLAYVMQDGCERLDFPPCDVAFLGGTDPWRNAWGAHMLARARAQGLRTHVGRVNSEARVKALALTECDSVDGTCLGFHGLERGVREIGRWLHSASTPLFQASDVTPAVTPLRLRGQPAAPRQPLEPAPLSLFDLPVPDAA